MPKPFSDPSVQQSLYLSRHKQGVLCTHRGCQNFPFETPRNSLKIGQGMKKIAKNEVLPLFKVGLGTFVFARFVVD